MQRDVGLAMLENRANDELRLVLLVFAYLIYPVRADADLWGHVYYGGEMWNSWSIPDANTYSFAVPEHPWTNHEWLFEFLMFGAYNLLGSAGLVLFFYAWVAAMIGTIVWYIRGYERTFGAFRIETLAAVILFFAPIIDFGMIDGAVGSEL